MAAGTPAGGGARCAAGSRVGTLRFGNRGPDLAGPLPPRASRVLAARPLPRDPSLTTFPSSGSGRPQVPLTRPPAPGVSLALGRAGGGTPEEPPAVSCEGSGLRSERLGGSGCPPGSGLTPSGLAPPAAPAPGVAPLPAASSLVPWAPPGLVGGRTLSGRWWEGRRLHVNSRHRAFCRGPVLAPRSWGSRPRAPAWQWGRGCSHTSSGEGTPGPALRRGRAVGKRCGLRRGRRAAVAWPGWG